VQAKRGSRSSLFSALLHALAVPNGEQNMAMSERTRAELRRILRVPKIKTERLHQLAENVYTLHQLVDRYNAPIVPPWPDVMLGSSTEPELEADAAPDPITFSSSEPVRKRRSRGYAVQVLLAAIEQLTSCRNWEISSKAALIKHAGIPKSSGHLAFNNNPELEAKYQAYCVARSGGREPKFKRKVQ
jgi:hypothetical protein